MRSSLRRGWRPLLSVLACAGLVGCRDANSEQNGVGLKPGTEVKLEASPSHAEPAPSPRAMRPPITPLPPAYRQGLREGRRQMRAANYLGAAREFRDALTAVPGDARVLSELSWALFKSGDFRGAERTARESIEGSTGALKAASLYNLGRVLEQQGDAKGAEQAYRASLALRPHAEVNARLAHMGEPDVAALAPQPCAGPFPTVEDLCTATVGTCAAKLTRLKVRGLVDPFIDVGWVDIGGGENQGRLLVRLPNGWYASEPFYERIIPDMLAASGSVTQVDVVRIAGRPALRFAATATEAGRFEDYEAQKLAFCAVGASGKPSCTPYIATHVTITQFDPESDEEDLGTTEVNLSVVLSGVKGAVHVSARGPVPADYRGLLGEHKLSFP